MDGYSPKYLLIIYTNDRFWMGFTKFWPISISTATPRKKIEEQKDKQGVGTETQKKRGNQTAEPCINENKRLF